MHGDIGGHWGALDNYDALKDYYYKSPKCTFLSGSLLWQFPQFFVLISHNFVENTERMSYNFNINNGVGGSCMHSYKINIDKKVLRLLGAQLYGDTPSIISELVQNAYDADATAVWITINTFPQGTIVVQDNGIGMTPDEINSRFLNIGQDRRSTYPVSPSGRKVLGRKGIGKLAVFSLAKIIDVYSTKDGEIAACRLDFDAITLHDGDPITLDESQLPIEADYLSKDGTGTKIVLQNIQKDVSRSLNYIVNRLIRTFDVNSTDFKIFIRKNAEPYKELARKGLNFFEYMDTIITFGDEFESKLEEVNQNDIPVKYKYTKKYVDLCAEKKFQIMPYQISVLDKAGNLVERNFSFTGWIGTMHERPLFKKFFAESYEVEGQTKFEVSLTDNRITVFSRGKIGEFDILPKTQTNRIADAYVIGEIYADIFEDDDLADMAISNRRGYDETDQRYVQLIRIITDVVSFITRRKEDINKQKKRDSELKGANSIKARFTAQSPKTQQAIKEKFSPAEQKDFQEELFQFGRAINLANETKRIFISHKTECAIFGKFLVRCYELIGMNVRESIIFTSMAELGVPYDQDIYDYLKSCFRDDLYVIFLFSRSFYNSNVCIAETGAAWATNKKYSNVVIDMGFSGIDKPINNSQIGVSLADLESDDLTFKLKCLIKNSLEATGFSPMPEDSLIDSAIGIALAEYKDSLVAPIYFPQRRYLATPVCPKCSSQMQLKVNEDNSLVYMCMARNCQHKLLAEIV